MPSSLRDSLKSLLRRLLDESVVRLVEYITRRVLARSLELQELQLQVRLFETVERLKKMLQATTPDNPALHGYKVYSQTDEDGIVENILERVERTTRLSKTFIEIGCGNGLENNSHYLLLKGFRGCWCDSSEKNIAFIEQHLGGLAFQQLLVVQRFVDGQNVRDLIEQFTTFLSDKEPDFCSLDIDGNDLAVLREILAICRPKTICVEYNAKFPPPVSLAMEYGPSYVWKANDYQGATLQTICNLLRDYVLVCCNLSGANAFFVRCDLSGHFERYSIADLYQPARYFLIHLSAGHPPTLRWARQKVRTATDVSPENDGRSKLE